VEPATTGSDAPNAPRPAGEPPGAAAGSLEEIFRAHHRLVFQAAYRITGNPMDAEDVLQTVFLRLARREDGHGLAPHPASYLHRAAVNAALDLLRARSRARSVALEDAGEELRDPRAGAEGGVQARELRDWLRRAVARLGPRAAEIFSLRYFEGFSNQQIARLLGTSQAVVAVVLHRTRGRLRKEIRPLAGGWS
jgi:RNA polymerase sigma-70 factor (ECF subfamily)